MKELKDLKDLLDTVEGLKRTYEDIEVLIEMAEEENDESVLPEIASELHKSFFQEEALKNGLYHI